MESYAQRSWWRWPFVELFFYAGETLLGRIPPSKNDLAESFVWFIDVYCTSWHHPTMIKLSIRFQFERIKPPSHQTTKATWQFAAFRSTKKNPPRMGNKPSFQCWVDIEGMNDINDVSIIHKWMKCFLIFSTGSKLVQSRFSVNCSFQSALQNTKLFRMFQSSCRMT